MKMNVCFGLILGLALLSVSQAFAGQLPLFTVGNDINHLTSTISVRTDDASGDLTGMFLDTDFYSVDEIRAGAVLKLDVADTSRRPLVLSGPNVNLSTGGPIILNYLHNGIDNNRQNFAMELRKGADGTWKAYVAGGSLPILSLFVSKNTLPIVGTVIGIDKITPKLGSNVD